jgi:hypothetical protein
MLCSMLDSHPDIRCELELLHRQHYRNGPTGIESHLRERLFDRSDLPIRGCKILYHQMFGLRNSKQVVSALRRLDCKFVHLMRWNQLDSFVSHVLAKRSKIWNAFRSRSIDQYFIQHRPNIHEEYNQPIKIDPAAYLTYKAKTVRWAKRVSQLCPDAFRIHYEDIDHRMPALLDFLGASPARLTADTVKLRIIPKSELVVNYAELKALL